MAVACLSIPATCSDELAQPSPARMSCPLGRVKEGSGELAEASKVGLQYLRLVYGPEMSLETCDPIHAAARWLAFAKSREDCERYQASTWQKPSTRPSGAKPLRSLTQCIHEDCHDHHGMLRMQGLRRASVATAAAALCGLKSRMLMDCSLSHGPPVCVKSTLG